MAAPTTAAFAIGAGPGPATAAPTTAALATGFGPGMTAAVTTAARPTRESLSGISASLRCDGGLVGLDGGDDRLDGDASVGDELAARTSDRRGEGRGPQVLVDQDACDAAGRHRLSEGDDVIGSEGLG